MKKVKKYKISRRLQAPVFEKCQTQKFVLREQRRVPKRTRGRFSEFGKQLKEKQKARYVYSISERVLKNYVKKAISTKGTPTDEVLAETLERRLDNIVFQLGLTVTRRMARQLTSHGHFTVNGVKSTIPSYQVKDNDVIGIRGGSKQTELFKDLLSGSLVRPRVNWVSWDAKKQEGKILEKPVIGDSIFSINSILEYYSR